MNKQWLAHKKRNKNILQHLDCVNAYVGCYGSLDIPNGPGLPPFNSEEGVDEIFNLDYSDADGGE